MSCLLVEQVGLYRITGELSIYTDSSKRHPNAQAFVANLCTWMLHRWGFSVIAILSVIAMVCPIGGTSKLSSTSLPYGAGCSPKVRTTPHST